MSENGNNQLFVYGSLRSGFHHPAYAYISDNFTLVGPAKIKGLLYDMGEYPAAIPISDESFIVGELYELKENFDFYWVIEQIDDYEGLNVEQDETALFKREEVEVYLSDRTTTAWVYWYNSDVSGRPFIPSGDILDYIKMKQ